uniref:Taste receptor type 1 member 1-like n=1 Tax=Sinocyclocheilus grahami TaxID=75366 RepID=A0A672PBM8_SINGR
MHLSSICSFLPAFINCFFFNVFCLESDFSLKGDYLLGGLFALHEVQHATPLSSPEAIQCLRYTFSKSGYQMLQVMRFAIEEINNSTTLLPNVSLGYEIFDHCTDSKNFHSVFSFISNNGLIKSKEKLNNYQPKVIALTGPYGSTSTIAIAPLITMDVIPLVNYGASSYALSNKRMYPSFIRTIIHLTLINCNSTFSHSIKVPFSNCSVECKEGFSREPNGYHSCCFLCKKCPHNSYVNYSLNSLSTTLACHGITMVLYVIFLLSIYLNIHLTLINCNSTFSHSIKVPFSNCSVECKEGFSREPNGYHSCCFLCKKCPHNSYVNYSWDPYTCSPCAESEWSDEGSTTCKNRSVVYLEVTEILSIIVMASATCLIILLIAIFCLFAHNYNTPVVKSAGGSMCFLMLACLIMSTISVFFFFGKPSSVFCILRNVAFAFFFTIFLSCMAVRSFQIVCVFKIAAKFPNIHSIWVKHNGQWLFVGFFSVIHLISCILWMTVSTPKPSRDSSTFKDLTILSCEMGNTATVSVVVFIVWFLGFLCLLFSYMGRDLPKNYNEAKSITFSLILYNMSWIVYFTTFLILKSKYIQLVNAMTQLSSIYGILFSYFIPKSYIIIFQPQKNTAAYFQTSIQNYTQTISRT